MKKSLILVSLCFLLSGCAVWNWLVTDDPDAPPVDPGNIPPPVIFKPVTTNNVGTNAIATTNVIKLR